MVRTMCKEVKIEGQFINHSLRTELLKTMPQKRCLLGTDQSNAYGNMKSHLCNKKCVHPMY